MKISCKLALITVATLFTVGAGCAKKQTAAAPPPPPLPSSSPAPSSTEATQPSRRETTPPPAPVATAPKPAYPDAPTRARIGDLTARIDDAYFDYDKHTLRADAIQALQKDVRELRDILKDYPAYKLTIEGHCDERGSAEYNVQLGQARADSAKNFLVQAGIPGDMLGVISYGKEKPVCNDESEGCWQKNRRIHIVPTT